MRTGHHTKVSLPGQRQEGHLLLPEDSDSCGKRCKRAGPRAYTFNVKLFSFTSTLNILTLPLVFCSRCVFGDIFCLKCHLPLLRYVFAFSLCLLLSFLFSFFCFLSPELCGVAIIILVGVFLFLLLPPRQAPFSCRRAWPEKHNEVTSWHTAALCGSSERWGFHGICMDLKPLRPMK